MYVYKYVIYVHILDQMYIYMSFYICKVGIEALFLRTQTKGSYSINRKTLSPIEGDELGK